MPGWCCACVETVSYASDDSAYDHVGNGVGCDLEDGSNRHDCRAEKDSLLASESVADEVGHDGSEETSYVVDCSDCAEKTAVVS